MVGVPPRAAPTAEMSAIPMAFCWAGMEAASESSMRAGSIWGNPPKPKVGFPRPSAPFYWRLAAELPLVAIRQEGWVATDGVDTYLLFNGGKTHLKYSSLVRKRQFLLLPFVAVLPQYHWWRDGLSCLKDGLQDRRVLDQDHHPLHPGAAVHPHSPSPAQLLLLGGDRGGGDGSRGQRQGRGEGTGGKSQEVWARAVGLVGSCGLACGLTSHRGGRAPQNG